MSTYNDPYVYGVIPGQASNTGTNRFSQMKLLQAWFEEANWVTSNVGGRLIIETSGVSAFGACLLGASQDVGFQVTFTDSAAAADMVVDSDQSCFDDGTDKEEEVTILDKNLASLVYTITGKEGSSSSANGLVAWKATGTTIALVHEMIWKVTGYLLASRIGGTNVVYYGTESNGTGGFKTTFGILGNAHIDWTMTYGGQLSTSATVIDGRGFLATSASNIVAGNYAEVYCFYESAAPVNTARSNQIRLSQRIGARFVDDPDIHPLVILWNQIGAPTSTSNTYTGITTIDDIRGFIGPYWYDLDQPTLGSLNCCVLGGALRIKAIEGEVGEPNIKRLLVHSGTNQRTSNANKNFKDGMVVTNGVSYFWAKEATIGEVTGFGTLFLVGSTYVSTAGLSVNPNGIMWTGDIATIFEPWIGWNWYDIDLSSESAPLLGQIPNCIIPWRAIGLGDPPSPNEIFHWDGKLWRYNQVNRYNTGATPRSSMAYNVSNSKVFNGTSYTGLEMYAVESLSIPGTLGNGASETVTITATTGQDLSAGGQCIIRANNQRIQFQGAPDHIVTFAAGSSTATVVIQDTGLEIAETVQLQVIGKDDSTVTLDISVLAS